MKKIIALMLVLCCMLAVVSCGPDPSSDPTAARVEEVKEMFKTSIPTKTVTTTVHKVESTVLTNTATLTTGNVNGKKVSVYVNNIEELAQVSNSLDPIDRRTTTLWYMEGMGTSKDKGATWDPEGTNFAPVAGAIRLQLDMGKATETTYDEATYTLVMKYAAKDANAVVSSYLTEDQKIDSDLVVTVVTSGGNVASIKLEYTIPSHDKTVEGATNEDGSAVTITIPESTVTITAVYEYDLQDVTLD